LMAIAMRRYCTTHIAWWRRSRAFIKATKHHHRARTRSDIAQSDTPTPNAGCFFDFVVKMGSSWHVGP
jgi:hypothetical protein